MVWQGKLSHLFSSTISSSASASLSLYSSSCKANKQSVKTRKRQKWPSSGYPEHNQQSAKDRSNGRGETNAVGPVIASGLTSLSKRATDGGGGGAGLSSRILELCSIACSACSCVRAVRSLSFALPFASGKPAGSLGLVGGASMGSMGAECERPTWRSSLLQRERSATCSGGPRISSTCRRRCPR